MSQRNMTESQLASHGVMIWPNSGVVQKYDCGFPGISRTRLLLFPDFSRHFVHLYLNKNITKVGFKRWNFLYNVVFYSKYQMGLKFLKFRTSDACVTNCKKINNCMGNQHVKNRHLHFPCQHYSFQGFFQTFPYLWSFSRLFKALQNFYIKFQDFPYFSRICTNPANCM